MDDVSLFLLSNCQIHIKLLNYDHEALNHGIYQYFPNTHYLMKHKVYLL